MNKTAAIPIATIALAASALGFTTFTAFAASSGTSSTNDAAPVADSATSDGAGDLRDCGDRAGRPMMDAETKTKVDAAIKNRDYNAWKAAVGDAPIANQVTADNFSKFAEAHELREAGKNEEAKAIMDELGIKPPHGHGHGPHMEHDDDGDDVNDSDADTSSAR